MTIEDLEMIEDQMAIEDRQKTIEDLNTIEDLKAIEDQMTSLFQSLNHIIYNEDADLIWQHNSCTH